VSYVGPKHGGDDPDDENLLSDLKQRQAGQGKRSADEFFGGAMMSFGVLLMILSGLCTGGALAMTISMMLGGYGTSMLSVFPAMLVIGGVPFAAGLALFVQGWRGRK